MSDKRDARGSDIVSRGQTAIFFTGRLSLAVLAFASGTRFTLNVPQVLLPLVPPSGVKANFTLTADKGCFKWCASIGLALDVV